MMYDTSLNSVTQLHWSGLARHFAGYEGTAIYDNRNIQIAAASYGDDVIVIPELEVWTFGDVQLPLIIGTGTILAGIIAFLTLRKRK